MRYGIVDGMNVRESRVHNYPPRWNGAPSQDLLVIRRNHQTGRYHCELALAASMRPWRREQFSRRRPLVSCAK
jgi:hypothetical protein